MANQPSKEATLGEVLEHISLADVGHALKYLFASLGCVVPFILIEMGVFKVGKIAFPDLHIPAVIWEAGIVAFYCLVLTDGKSYHIFHREFWFPKLRWFGVPLMTIYLVSLVELWKAVGFWSSYLGLMPGLIFFGLCQDGHTKLMKDREAKVN